MAKIRPGYDIDIEAEQTADHKAALPDKLIYLTWYGAEVVHVSNDRKMGMCGVTAPDPKMVILSGTPLGKPRCMDCVRAADLSTRENEPEPFRGFEAEDTVGTGAPAPTQELPMPPVQPTMPPEFFAGQALPDDVRDIP